MKPKQPSTTQSEEKKDPDVWDPPTPQQNRAKAMMAAPNNKWQ
jgi:hypothetical protein